MNPPARDQARESLRQDAPSIAAENSANLIAPRGIDWLLLDIEGTTCPVSFVAATLFPYASQHLDTFLRESADIPEVQNLLREVDQAWEQDQAPAAAALLKQRESSEGEVRALPYLRWLIRENRKLTPLKELQGMMWERGYARGELLAPLYPDVPTALQRWHRSGLRLAVYSSGSVAAQQLLYAHTSSGDLRGLFSDWFDTRIGSKKEVSSYADIASRLECLPERVLFISDSLAELRAADTAGMQVLFSDRDGNPERNPGCYQVIGSYALLQPVC